MTDTATLARKLTAAHRRLKGAIEAHHEAAERLSVARDKLECARTHAVLGGLEGRSQLEQSAELDSRLIVQLSAMRTAERELAAARLELELARLEFDYALRLLELEARTT